MCVWRVSSRNHSGSATMSAGFVEYFRVSPPRRAPVRRSRRPAIRRPSASGVLLPDIDIRIVADPQALPPQFNPAPMLDVITPGQHRGRHHHQGVEVRVCAAVTAAGDFRGADPSLNWSELFFDPSAAGKPCSSGSASRPAPRSHSCARSGSGTSSGHW